MFLINFQLRARNRKIPAGGRFNVRGGFDNRGKGLFIPFYAYMYICIAVLER